jgi:hypothetical protein
MMMMMMIIIITQQSKTTGCVRLKTMPPTNNFKPQPFENG